MQKDYKIRQNNHKTILKRCKELQKLQNDYKNGQNNQRQNFNDRRLQNYHKEMQKNNSKIQNILKETQIDCNNM